MINMEPERKKIYLSPIRSPVLCSTPCAQCVTQLALRNEVDELREYLAAACELNPYVVVPFDQFTKRTLEGYDTESEMANLIEYLLRDQGDEHAHSEETSQSHREGCSAHSILPFYYIVFEANWILPEVISLILQSKLVDPMEIHHAFSLTNDSYGLKPTGDSEHLEFSITNKGVTLLTSIYQSTHRNSMSQLLRLNPELVSRQFPMSSLPFAWCGCTLISFFLKLAPFIYLDEPLRLCNGAQQLRLHGNSFIYNNCLFQIKILKPLLELGVDVNGAGNSVFNYLCQIKEFKLNLFATLISNGLMDFTTTGIYSPAVRILTKACKTWNGERQYQMSKAVMLVQLTHSLGASMQTSSAQKADEANFVSYIKGPTYAEHEQDLARYLKDETRMHHGKYSTINRTVSTMEGLWSQRKNPLQLTKLCRIAVRNALGGRWFSSLLTQLTLPSSMKAFLQADLSTQIEQVDRDIDKAVRLTV